MIFFIQLKKNRCLAENLTSVSGLTLWMMMALWMIIFGDAEYLSESGFRDIFHGIYRNKTKSTGTA